MRSLLWRIGVPSGVGMFFNTMFNTVDTYCAGLLGTDALAALSLSFPVFFVVFAVGSGLAQGTTALLGNALGAGDTRDARRLFAQSMTLATLAGLVLALLGLALAPWLFRQFGATGAYLRTALEYIDVLLAGSVFMVLPMTLNAALAAQGETRTYRNVLIAGFVANCVLNPLLMWGGPAWPPLGVAGIALATVLIQIAGCLVLWRRVASSELGHGLSWSLCVPDVVAVRRILAQSLPACVNMLTVALGIFVITGFVQGFGRDAVAALGIATRIEQAVLMPVIGFCSAILSIVARNHGAGLPSRVREAWLTGIGLGVAATLVGGMALVFLGEVAVSGFTTEASVMAKGADYLRLAAFTLPAYPILFGTVFLMQGMKRPAYGLWIGLYRQGVAPLLLIPLLAYTMGLGLWGVWWGICAVNWSAALFGLGWGWRQVAAPRLRIGEQAAI